MLDFLRQRRAGEAEPDWNAIFSRGARVIDVRSPQEFQSGHAPDSVNIPLGDIGNVVGELRNSGEPVVLCCASGNRSGMAQRKLSSLGIEAYNAGPWQRVLQIQGN